MTTPFNLDKALAGHTVYFRGEPVSEWHYFPSLEAVIVSYNGGAYHFDREGVNRFYNSSLTLGPRVAWAVYNRTSNRLDTVALFPSREEALHYCDSTTTPVQVIIEV